jgi:hypothetical protein
LALHEENKLIMLENAKLRILGFKRVGVKTDRSKPQDAEIVN